MRKPSKSRFKDYLPPLTLLVSSIFFLSWSYIYDVRARQAPVLVGWSMVILCILDIIATSETTIGQAVKSFFAGKIVGESSAQSDGWRLSKIFAAMAWPVAFVGLVFVFGFVPVIPFYVFFFVVLQGRKGIRQGFWAAVGTTLFAYVVFEKLLRYEVYKGVLFGG